MIPAAYTTALAGRVQGVPAPQPLYADDLMVSVLIVCGLMLAAVLSDRKLFLSRLLKGFFLPREQANENVRTTNIIHMRSGMFIVTFASVGLLLVTSTANHTLGTISSGLLWLLAAVVAALFYLLKRLLFLITDHIFFEHSLRIAWEQSYANWILLSGVPLYLASVIVVFFDLAPSVVLWLLGACAVLLEICLLYKAFCIFSDKKYGILQLFLYLCTLELIPLLVAGKALVLFV